MQPKQKQGIIIAIVILLFFIGIGGGYYFGMKQMEHKKDIVIQKLQAEKVQLETKFEPYRIAEEQKKKEQVFLKSLDLQTDSSLQKFVTSGKSFSDKAYIPEKLETIASEFVVDAKGGTSKMRPEANAALQKMAQKFYADMGYKLVNVSAYRSYNYQLGIENGGCPPTMCARAGFSEHQSGLAIDFFSASNEQTWKQSKKYKEVFSWLKENAHTFGFHNSYQRGPEVDGYVVEPWHWRYLGTEFSTYLQKHDMTFAEYYDIKSK